MNNIQPTKMTKLILILTVLFTLADAKHIHKESHYQNIWCKAYNGEIEHILPDRTRVDCLTDTHAVEFDFANKWAEAVGQSLYYALMTGKAPAIALIMENPTKDQRYLNRLKKVANKHNIKIIPIKLKEK